MCLLPVRRQALGWMLTKIGGGVRHGRGRRPLVVSSEWLSDEDVVIEGGMMGAPTVTIEKLR